MKKQFPYFDHLDAVNCRTTCLYKVTKDFNMGKTGIFILMFILCLTFSCSSNQKYEEKINPIVIIFDSIKTNYDTIFLANGGEIETTSSILSIKMAPRNYVNLKMKDTISFTPISDSVLVYHRYLPHSSIEFMLKSGDTAHIDYCNEVPYIRIVNRQTKKYDINFDYYKRKRYTVLNGMQIFDIIKNPLIYITYQQQDGIKTSLQKVVDEFYPRLLIELEDENLWLDTLLNSNQISINHYGFYKEKNKYTRLNCKFEISKYENIANILTSYNDSIYANDFYGYYRSYFYNVGFHYLDSIYSSMKNNEYTKLYDRLDNTADLKGVLYQDVKLYLLQIIMNNYSFKERKDYFDRFISTVSDTLVVQQLKQRYKTLLDPQISNSTDLQLLAVDGEKTTLTEVLKECAGKVVYVDFWASWCSPCIKEMPHSSTLRNAYATKDVEFVYLAVNDKEQAWKAALEKADLKKVKHSYLILNSKDASFLTDHKINTIPRYMIFGKDGILLNDNAPGPSSKLLKLIE